MGCGAGACGPFSFGLWSAFTLSDDVTAAATRRGGRRPRDRQDSGPAGHPRHGPAPSPTGAPGHGRVHASTTGRRRCSRSPEVREGIRGAGVVDHPVDRNGPAPAAGGERMARAARGLATVLVAGSLALAAVVPVHGRRARTGAARARRRPPLPRASRPAAARPRRAPPRAGPPAPAGWAPAATAAIRPGVRHRHRRRRALHQQLRVRRGDRRFLGQAAHCAGTGVATETDGCASGTRPLGTAVTIDAADGSRRTGRLAYSSWITMQDPRRDRPGRLRAQRLRAGRAGRRGRRGRGQPEPAGAAAGRPGCGADGCRPANRCSATAGPRSAGRSPRPAAGTTGGEVGAGFGHEIHTASPGVPGESGSALRRRRRGRVRRADHAEPVGRAGQQRHHRPGRRAGLRQHLRRARPGRRWPLGTEPFRRPRARGAGCVRRRRPGPGCR